MTYPIAQQVYTQASGTAKIQPFRFDTRDPSSYDTQYQLYTGWVNTNTHGIWYLESFSTTAGVTTATWRAVAPIVTSSSDPASPLTASSDYSYPIGQTWVNTSGNNYFVMTSNPTATTGYWIQLSAGTTGVDLFALQTGSTPIGPDSSGIVTFSGAVVAAGTHPVRTDGTASTTMTLEVQTSQAIASPDATKIGLSNFNSAHFSVDSTGYVGLLGGGQAVDSFQVDNTAGTGVNPVVPTVAGLVTVTCAQVPAAGFGNAIRTITNAPNQYTITIQQSSAFASSNTTKNGVCHFNSAQFTVDGNGFVSSTTGNQVVIQTFTANGTYTPTSGMDQCIIECVGGGGGGGGTGGPGSNNNCPGGGGGGYSRGIFNAATIGVSQAVTVGAGGAGGVASGGFTGNAGTPGGTSSVGALISATGGGGGTAATAGSGTYDLGGAGGVGSGGSVNSNGGVGLHASGGSGVTGYGGNSILGGGANSVTSQGGAVTQSNGSPGLAYGGGGSGAFTTSGAGSGSVGGAGFAGIVIITEFI